MIIVVNAVSLLGLMLIKGEASLESALRSASGGIFDVNQLAEVMREKLDIAGLQGGIETNKNDIAATRGSIAALRGGALS